MTTLVACCRTCTFWDQALLAQVPVEYPEDLAKRLGVCTKVKGRVPTAEVYCCDKYQAGEPKDLKDAVAQVRKGMVQE